MWIVDRIMCIFLWSKIFRAISPLPPEKNFSRAPISSINILTGNNNCSDIMSTERMKIEKGLYIIKSTFGWMIKGRAKSQEGNEHENAMLIMTHFTQTIYFLRYISLATLNHHSSPHQILINFRSSRPSLSSLLRKLRLMMEWCNILLTQ